MIACNSQHSTANLMMCCAGCIKVLWWLRRDALYLEHRKQHWKSLYVLQSLVVYIDIGSQGVLSWQQFSC